MTKAYYTFLPNRAAVTVTGPEAEAFLQGLVTQDMALLAHNPVLYSTMLTAQGKIDTDFFVTREGDTIILECDSGKAEGLARKLSMFKLRRNLAINTAPVQVLAVWGEENALKAFPYPSDPRDSRLGLRKISLEPIDINSLNGAESVDFDFYDRLRLDLAIPDGPRDFAVGEDTVTDINLEKLNGVSFSKGCYLGQELTSRMHHRNLGKKALYGVLISGAALPPFTDIVVDENLIGEMRSSNGKRGMAMLRHDSLDAAAKAGLTPLPR